MEKGDKEKESQHNIKRGIKREKVSVRLYYAKKCFEFLPNLLIFVCGR